VKRRTFLKGSAAAVGGAVALGFDLKQARAEMRELKIARTTETRSTCPYCSVSCGVIIHTLGDKSKNVKPSVVHVEGDPDHPINRGTLCPKGITLRDDITSSSRLTTPQVRRPGSDKWGTHLLGQGDRRDRAPDQGHARPHLRREECEGRDGEPDARHGMIGGCTDTNEMNFLMLKTIAGLGIPYRDTQARV